MSQVTMTFCYVSTVVVVKIRLIYASANGRLFIRKLTIINLYQAHCAGRLPLFLIKGLSRYEVGRSL
jgi:hypothetical protein